MTLSHVVHSSCHQPASLLLRMAIPGTSDCCLPSLNYFPVGHEITFPTEMMSKLVVLDKRSPIALASSTVTGLWLSSTKIRSPASHLDTFLIFSPIPFCSAKVLTCDLCIPRNSPISTQGTTSYSTMVRRRRTTSEE